MGYDPVELITIAKSVLDEMDVIPDPDVDLDNQGVSIFLLQI
jgi:hypothetical protein